MQSSRKKNVRKNPKGRKLNRKQKQQVKRLIGRTREIKHVDTSVISDITAGGYMFALGAPQQGADSNQRVGNDITLKKLHVSMNFVGADSTNALRFIIFRWSQNNAATTPAGGDVISTSNALGLYNHASIAQGKIHIVFDRLITFSLNGENDKAVRKIIYGRALGKKKLSFNLGSTTTTGTDQFYVYMVSDSVAASHPGAAGYFRLEYTDS